MVSVPKIIVQRVLLGALTLWIVSIIIFFGVYFLPGDVATEMLGQAATPDTVAAFRKSRGLDLPLYTRYFSWLLNVLSGNFGNALASGRDIAGLIQPRLFNTFFLAVTAAVIAVPIALLAGILTAIYRNSFFDRTLNAVTLASISFPEFFVAYILILLLAVNAEIFPSLSYVGSGTGVFERLIAVALPAFTLTLVVVAHMMRMTRAAIINLLASPYIEMATLKGIPRSRIIIGHALPNAWAPIINVIVINLAYLVVGVVVVEVVFVYPGLGQLMVDSVQKRDIPVVQACSLVFAATYILLNLTADILVILTNPRLMYRR